MVSVAGELVGRQAHLPLSPLLLLHPSTANNQKYSAIHDVSRWLVVFPTLLHVDIALLFQYVISVLKREGRKTAWIVMHKDDYVSNHILSGAFFDGVGESVKDRISLIICATLEELSTFVSNEWGQTPDILVFVNVASLFQDVLMTEFSETIASMLALVSLKSEGRVERVFVSIPEDLVSTSRSRWTQWAEGRIECKLTSTFGNERSQFITISLKGTCTPTPVLVVRWDFSGRMTLVGVKE